MTTILGNEDPFEEVERGIDWLERLENIRERQDREAAMRETVEYVEMLRGVLMELSGRRFIGIGCRGVDSRPPW